jgi:murein DD-endopeptidase MepM/ murein hydrolase activator NlpD
VNVNGKTYWFFYAHLSETLITAKDKEGKSTKLKAGEKIGKSGKTGSSATALNANQVHLHFEVRTTSARTGGRVSPFENISELNTEVIKEPKKESQP